MRMAVQMLWVSSGVGLRSQTNSQLGFATAGHIFGPQLGSGIASVLNVANIRRQASEKFCNSKLWNPDE